MKFLELKEFVLKIFFVVYVAIVISACGGETSDSLEFSELDASEEGACINKQISGRNYES